MNTLCPCFSGDTYTACCQPLHLGQAAPNAERLMRSRYSAHAQKLPDYLLQTWHAQTRPASLTLADLNGIKWLKLQVLSHTQRDADTAFVHYVATLQIGKQKKQQLIEHSRFTFEQGQWWYIDGEIQAA